MEDFKRFNCDMADNLLHNLPGMVYRCLNDEAFTFVFVSEGCELVTGYQPHELIDGNIIGYEELILPEDRAAAREVIDQGLKENTRFQVTYRIRSKDGSIRWVWEQGVGVKVPGCEDLHIDGVIIDITCARNLESRLEESVEQLEQLNLVKDRFLDFVLHDLQDPVLSFISLSNFMCQNIDSFSKEELVDCLNQIRDSSQRMNLILEGIYKWAKYQKQMDNFQPRPIRLDALVSDIKNSFAPHFDSKKLSFTLDYPADKVIHSDSNVLFILVATLLSNAIKYSHPGGKIGLKFNIETDQLIISVRDEGVGIPSSKMQQLFSIKSDYIRNGTSNESGSGLGLALAKKTIDSLGGTIEVDSKPGKGSIFTIKLPLQAQQ